MEKQAHTVMGGARPQQLAQPAARILLARYAAERGGYGSASPVCMSARVDFYAMFDMRARFCILFKSSSKNNFQNPLFRRSQKLLGVFFLPLSQQFL
jgi:hypothetical protein